MLHHGSLGWVHSKDKHATLYRYTYTFLAFFVCLFFSLFFVCFFTLFFIKYLNFYPFTFLLWWSIKFSQQNINHSETGYIYIYIYIYISVLRNGQCNCMNGLFQEKTYRGGEGWGHGNSRGQEKEFTGVIKKKSCGIFTGLGCRSWNFQWVQYNFWKFRGWSFILSGISSGKVTNLNF